MRTLTNRAPSFAMAAMLKSASTATAVTLGEFQECINAMFSKAAPYMKSIDTSCFCRHGPLGSLMNSRIAVALSGGPDSLALCALLRKIYPKNKLMALFVHHNMQSRGVTEDPSVVKTALEQLDVEGRFLYINWGDTELQKLTKGQTQERLREKRYRLMLEACAEDGISLLLTGHNCDDNIVTMLYRLAHGSGIEGLAGMKPLGLFPITHGLCDTHALGHPLLGFTKERLLKTCKDFGLTWNVDKGNKDLEYRRNSVTLALATMQEQSVVTLEELQEMQAFFQSYRQDLHEQIKPVFNRSVAINQQTGDAILVLNDEKMVQNWPVCVKVVSILAHFASARFTPLRTGRLLEISHKIIQAYKEHQRQLRSKSNRLIAKSRASGLKYTHGPVEQSKRLETGQMCVGGAVFYPLIALDTMRRLMAVDRHQHRKLAPGPALLVQREPVSGLNSQQTGFRAEEIELAPGEDFIWDGRLVIQYEAASPERRRFAISFMSAADAKEFTSSANRAAIRSLYQHLGMTPGSHLYQIPMIREIGSDYMAFPSLHVANDGQYTWKVKTVGVTALISRFQFEP